MKCNSCGAEISPNDKFCENCGEQIIETIFCPNCGEQTSTEFEFCQSCGTSLTETHVEEQPETVPAEKKKRPKKAIMFGGAGIAVVAVLIIVASLFFSGGGNSENNYALYLKDSEIFFTDLKKDSKALQLTSRFIDSYGIDEDYFDYYGEYLSLSTYMSEDGKYIFFPDKIGDDDYGLNLYYKEVDKPDAEAIKIDSDVVLYTVNTSATLVTYLKGDEGNLYQYKIGEDSKEKIASEVSDFEVSDDGNKIIYTNFEDSIYFKYADEEKEKIASDVSSLEYVTEDFTAVYYIKDGSLYKKVKDKDKVKIASDVYEVISIYDSGEIYYLTNENEEISLKDYVTDDMKEFDAAITEPEYPDYPDSPSFWDYDSYEEYEEAYDAWNAEYDRILNDYYEALEVYWTKDSRDELRVALEEETLDLSRYSLCFYNGKEEIVVTDSFIDGYFGYTYASDTPVIAYNAYNRSSFKKVNLSEVESIYDIEELIEESMLSSSDLYIAVEDTATVIEQEKEATSFTINSSGTIAYYIDDIPEEKDYGNLYRISISKGTPGKPEVYDKDVYVYDCDFVSDTEIKYFKDYKDGKGELYIDKNKTDYDVDTYNVEAYSYLGKIVYFTDWNDDKEYGTLNVYDGKEKVKIAEDVHSFSVIPDGRILYLYDYSIDYYNGELHEWSDGKTRKIDDDVVCIMPILYNKYRGLSYGW